MQSYSNVPTAPKWVYNTELATNKYWHIKSGKCTTGTALAICNHIITTLSLPQHLRALASKLRTELIYGRSRPLDADICGVQEVLYFAGNIHNQQKDKSCPVTIKI